MKILYTIIVLLLCFTASDGQTFRQTLNENNYGLNAINFGGLTVAAAADVADRKITIYGLDKYGYPLWTTETPAQNNNAGEKPLLKVSDDKFALILSRNNKLIIEEYDLNGELKKEIPVIDEDNGEWQTRAFAPGPGGGYIVFALSDSSIRSVVLKSNGDRAVNFLGKLTVNWPNKISLYAVSENEHLLAIDGSLTRYVNGVRSSSYNNSNYTRFISFRKEGIYRCYSDSYSDNNRYASGYDFEGNLISGPIEIKLSEDILNFFSTSDNGYIFETEKKLYKISSGGQIEWERVLLPENRSTKYFINDFIETEDSYIYTGYYGYDNQPMRIGVKPRILRTEKNNFCRFLDLTYFAKYESDHIEKIKLEYSLDEGATWHNYAEAPVREGRYFFRIYGDGVLRDRNLEPYLHFDLKYATLLQANNVNVWISNYGMDSHKPSNDDSGLYWDGSPEPQKTAVFQDGFLMGFKENGRVFVNGSTYRTGMGIGPVELNPELNRNKDYYSIFHITKDTNSVQDGELRHYLAKSYNNWPVEYGARWIDKDNNNKYEPAIDEPEFLGDDVLYAVTNFADAEHADYLYGSPPADVEVRKTVYASNEDPVKDVVFKKYQVINKTENYLEDVYFTYWADPDLGDATDDYMGSDSSMNLMYVYNGENNDLVYGEAPPAVGYMMVQGPALSADAGDSAYFKNRWVKGKSNIDITSSSFMIGGSSEYTDAPLGVYQGAIEMYNYMQGLMWDGSPMINKLSGEETKFALAGDPVEGTGWYEGPGWPDGHASSDRRSMISAGPFNLAPGDTQEAAYAILLARGTDNINSVAKLKELAVQVQEYYNSYISAGTEKAPLYEKEENLLPERIVLYQNYPNPFNATTTIRFELPKAQDVSLKIYDILGREVYSIPNKVFNAGRNQILLNTAGLASGVYLYRMEAENFSEIKKMVLLK